MQLMVSALKDCKCPMCKILGLHDVTGSCPVASVSVSGWGVNSNQPDAATSTTTNKIIDKREASVV